MHILKVDFHPGVFDYGLMGSMKSIPQNGMQLDTIMVRGNSFNDAFAKWGRFLRDYHGRPLDLNREDIVSDFLGNRRLKLPYAHICSFLIFSL